MYNACNMIRDWSKDRFHDQGKKAEKPFSYTPGMNKQSWTYANDFLFKDGKAICKSSKDVLICTKNENKALINLNYVHGRYHLLPLSFDTYVKYFEKVRLMRLNRTDWM